MERLLLRDYPLAIVSLTEYIWTFVDIAAVKRDQQDPRISFGRCSGGMRGKGRCARVG